MVLRIHRGTEYLAPVDSPIPLKFLGKIITWKRNTGFNANNLAKTYDTINEIIHVNIIGKLIQWLLVKL